MPQRDPALLDTLRLHVDRARESGEYVEGPWVGGDNLILSWGVTRFEGRYLVSEPAARGSFRLPTSFSIGLPSVK